MFPIFIECYERLAKRFQDTFGLGFTAIFKTALIARYPALLQLLPLEYDAPLVQPS